MNKRIDWEGLSRQLNLIGDGDSSEVGGTEAACRALELLLGRDAIRDSVDLCLSCQLGSGLARSVLWLLRPWSAMERCYQVYRESHQPDQRRLAVGLLGATGDRRALQWVPEFLDDLDEGVRECAARLLDQLHFSCLVELEEIEDLLSVAKKHENPSVREAVEGIRDREARRREE